jgi:hypothetical protein
MKRQVKMSSACNVPRGTFWIIMKLRQMQTRSGHGMKQRAALWRSNPYFHIYIDESRKGTFLKIMEFQMKRQMKIS